MNWRQHLPNREQIERNRWLGWLVPWLGHPRLWHWSRRGVAMGVALGVFFGLLVPLAQIPLSVAAAVALRANVPAAVASTLVSNPVTVAPLYLVAYQLGNWVTGERQVAEKAGETAPVTLRLSGDEGLLGQLKRVGKPLLIGLAMLAILVGSLTYVVISVLWRWRVMRRRRQRRRSSS